MNSKPKKQGRRPNEYLVNGKAMDTKSAAKLLGYSSASTLNRRVNKLGIPPGCDISHLLASESQRSPIEYVVNGELMSITRAAKTLGYKTNVGLAKKLKTISPGTDISHMLPTAKTEPKIYVVNGVEMSLDRAAKALGYSSGTLIHKKIKKLSIPLGGDISHLKRRTPRTSKITSKNDALIYISGALIKCLECGKTFSLLANHLKKAHGMTVEEYRVKFNIPAGIPLAGKLYRDKHRDKMRRLITDGIVTHWHLADAVEKSRASGRGKRRDFDLAEQAERMKRNARYTQRTLPPGSKRANGKDADREREYQRAYRALKSGDHSLMIEYKSKYGRK